MDGVAADAGTAPAGGATTPLLDLDGFSGPLETLLALARAHQVDLACISLPSLVDQLADALRERAAMLGEKADWLVMAAWLMLLRSRLLLPADTREQRAAAADAERLRGALLAAGEMQALAAWLAQRPQLGRDVFARGQSEFVGLTMAPEHEVDVVEFLWAALDLFDDDLPPVDTTTVYRPPMLDLYPVQDARARILRLLAQSPEGQLLDRLLPEEEMLAEAEGEAPLPRSALRRHSAWSSTFAASLDLAKQGEARLTQERGGFTPILVSPVGVAPAPGEAAPSTERDLR